MIDIKAISITRLHDGSYECATVLCSRRVHYRYFGYTRREALQMFIEYITNEGGR